MLSPDYSKRDYLLPKGCKDLIDVINLQAGKPPPLPWPTPVKDAAMSKAELESQIKLTSGHILPITGEILVSETTQVSDLAAMLGQKPFKIIADLMGLGVFANVKQSLDFETVCKIARKYGYAAKRRT